MNGMQKSIIYLKMSVKAVLQQPSANTLAGLIKFLPAWLLHLSPDKNPVVDALPWLTFGAIEFLKRRLKQDMKVFEYGSGGSTLFWAAYSKEVVSVEHDSEWFIQMSNELKIKNIRNTTYIHAPAEADPDFSHKNHLQPSNYVSSDINYKGQKFENYVKTIDIYPDRYFDLIVVDGRARPSCILHAIPKLKRGGYLVIDNSERKYYMAPFKFNKPEWKKWIFNGAVPYNLHFSETTILRKLYSE